MVTEVTFVCFTGGDRPNRLHWIRPWSIGIAYKVFSSHGRAKETLLVLPFVINSVNTITKHRIFSIVNHP